MSFATNTIKGGVSTGKFGVSDQTGRNTYYSDFQTAIDAAAVGQTVELFADVVETADIEVNLKQGVAIQGNGHSYTLDNASISSALRATNVDVDIFNINIRRIGGTGPAFTFTSDSLVTAFLLNFHGTKCFSGSGRGANFTSTGLQARVYGLNAQGSTRGIVNINCLLFDSYGEGVTEYGIDTRSGGKSFHCNAYSRDSFGHYVVLGGYIEGCTGYSDGIDGIFVNQSTARNSYGESTGRYGVFIGNDSEGHGITGFSSVNFGVYMINNAKGSRVKGESLLSYGVTIFSTVDTTMSIDGLESISHVAPALFVNENATQTNTFELSSVNLRCNWDNASGDAVFFQLGNGNVEILGGVLRVTNTNAFCLNDNGEGDEVTYLGLIFAGSSNPVRGSINQGQNPLTAEDGFGNIRKNN